MPRTAGVFALLAGTKGVTLQTIQSGKYNAFLDDLVNDLNAPRPILAGGTGASTADGAAKELGLVSAKDMAGVNTVGGTANAVTIATDRVYTSLTNSLFLRFIAKADIAAGGMTINLDSIGAKPVKKVVAVGQVDVNAGDIIEGGYYELGYDPTSDNGTDPDGAFILLNPGNASSAYQVGDYLDTARTLNSDWLRRNGSIHLIADYPELAALLPALTDTVLWTNLTSGTASAINAGAYGNGKWVAVGAGGLILVSTDKVTWSLKTSGTTNALIGVAYGNGIWVAISQAGTVCVSSDTETWSTTSVGGSFVPLSICFGAGIFVIGGAISNVSAIVTTTNGTTFSANKLGAGVSGSGVEGIAYNGAFFLACTSITSTFFKSTDANTWTSSVAGGTSDQFVDIATDGTTFVAVGVQNGVILTTTNGTSFTSRTSGVSSGLRGVAYSASAGWMIVGSGGLSLISSNLATWTAVATGTTSQLNCVAADNVTAGLYLVGGAGGLLLSGQRTLPTQFRTPDDNPTSGWIKAVS